MTSRLYSPHVLLLLLLVLGAHIPPLTGPAEPSCPSCEQLTCSSPPLQRYPRKITQRTGAVPADRAPQCLGSIKSLAMGPVTPPSISISGLRHRYRSHRQWRLAWPLVDLSAQPMSMKWGTPSLSLLHAIDLLQQLRRCLVEWTRLLASGQASQWGRIGLPLLHRHPGQLLGPGFIVTQVLVLPSPSGGLRSPVPYASEAVISLFR